MHYFGEMADEDLLKILEAHGQQFLQSFEGHISTGKRKEGPSTAIDRNLKKKKPNETHYEEEWAGITGLGSGSSEDEEDGGEGTSDEDDTDEEQEDDEEDNGMFVFYI